MAEFGAMKLNLWSDAMSAIPESRWARLQLMTVEPRQRLQPSALLYFGLLLNHLSPSARLQFLDADVG